MIKEDINKAVEILNRGGIILYPTDTIWGLGCDAVNPEAVAKIYEIKQRSEEKSMLILLNNPGRIYSYADVPETASDIIELSEKPVTVIYPGAKNLAPNLIAPDGSIGIRITKEEFTYKLLEKFKKPVVSTSANIAGEPSPAIFSEISDEIKSKVDYIVKYRQDDTEKKQSSSIIKLEMNNTVKIIRE